MSWKEVTGTTEGLASDDRLEATIATDQLMMEPSPIPTRVGRYEVSEQIGSGSMGVVLRAHDPRLDREVAIKLLRSNTSKDRNGHARLQREAQALAKLSHPNVIDVFDVGIAHGQVFVAMEYVAGQTLDAWQRNDAPSRAVVIDAYLQAGRGLAAAHHAGLVHRDFKPANVLRGVDGRVRVVDFGLAAPPREHEAKATLGSLDEDPTDVRMTATGFVVGTPAYMSPESHCGDPVDAQSDQFSFCISLFEALWGARPFVGKTAKEVAAQAVTGDVQFPSGVDVPATLRDVVLRGLSPSPEDRWPSMDALLERLKPRRRSPWPWLAVAGATAVAASGLLYAGSSVLTSCEPQAEVVEQIWSSAVQEQVHQAFTRSALSYVEETWPRVRDHLDEYASALAEARRQACGARVSRSVPAQQLDRRVTCLERRTDELRGVIAVLEQADAATVRNAVRVLSSLESPDDCDDDALAATLPPPPPAVAQQVERARRDLAEAKAKLRAGQYTSAEALAQEVIARAEPLGYAPFLAEVRYLLARVLESDGRYQAAEREMNEAVMIAQGANHDELVAEISTELIYVVGSKLRRPEESERWVRHARAAIGRLSDAREAKTFLESTLGNFHWSRGELGVAREHFERALEAREQTLGPRHPTTLVVRSNLAMVLHDLGDSAEARALIERTLADRVEVYGPSHPMIATTHGNLGIIEQAMGKLDDSAEHTRRALELLERSVGREHPHYPQLLINLSNNEYYRGNVGEALRLQEQARDLLVRIVGPRDFLVARALSNLGAFYYDVERYADARVALVEAREIYEEHLHTDHPELAGAIGNLANVDRATGRTDQAIASYDEASAMIERALGPDHPELSPLLLGRGQAYLDTKQFERAVADMRRAVALLGGAEIDPEQVAKARYELATALWAASKPDEARGEIERARALVDRPARDEDDLPAKLDAWLAEHPRGSSD
ncbi:MAG: tetratricopeptide repeat protein [Myxococcota bacterium]